MKIILIYLSFVLILFSENLWHTDLEKALSISAKENKPILINLYADWCKYCKVLDSKILPTKEVEEELNKFVTIRMNGEENSFIIQKYNVNAYPTILFLDKDGNFLDKVSGLPDANGLIEKLQMAYNRKDYLSSLIAKQTKEPDLVETNYVLGNFYYKNGNFPKAIEFFRNAFNSKNEKPVEEKSQSLFFLGISLLQEQKFSEASSVWNLYMEKYPTSKEDSIYYLSGITYFFEEKNILAKEKLILAKKFHKNKEQLQKIEEILKKL